MARWVLAIDFGTTTTSAAVGVDGRYEVVEIDGVARMPSVVLATDSGDLVVGSAADAQVGLAPERAERTPKRRLGDEVMLLGSRPVRPVDAVAAIFTAISAEAIRRQGGVAPAELRLTHPARWGSVRRRKLAEAAELAGLPHPVFVPEPVAAAVHFADERIDDGAFVAVYDLGGGTFDTAVLRRQGDGFEVIGLPGGNEHLGGEAFDERLFHHVGNRIAEEQPEAWELLRFSTDRSWRKAGHDLRNEVRRAKEALSANAEYTVYVGSPVDATVLVTRDELEGLIRADVASTIDELEATVQRAGLSVQDLAAVNLAGGSSRIPLVTRLVAERFDQLPQTWGDPKAAVALGAVKATRLTSVATGGTGSNRIAGSGAPLPEKVGGYEVVTELGRGGMGVVYLARQSSVGRLVAVKSLPVVDPSLTDRLRREAAVLAELQHPHIATVIDVASDERGTHVVMPYFPGGTAAHVLDHSGRLSAGQAATILASVADALAATHDKGFLHRDVKPSNVLLSEAGDAYLADFGLALPMLDSSRLTNSRSVLGTAPYTAPEILSDDTPTSAADTYSLGVTGFQLLTGELPYSGSNVLAVLDAVRRGTPTPIGELAPEVPPALAELVTAAFAADPGERPADLRAWASQVRAAARPDSVAPSPPAAWALAASGAAQVARGAAATRVDGTPVVATSGPPTDRSGAEPAPEAEAASLAPADGEGAERTSRTRLAIIGGIAAALLLVVGAIALFSGDGDEQKVEVAGATEVKVDETTTTAAPTTTVAATVAPATVGVPAVVGLGWDEAAALLTGLGLVASPVEVVSDAAAGTVIATNPPADTQLAVGASVEVTVAQGAAGSGGGAPSGGGGGGGTGGGLGGGGGGGLGGGGGGLGGQQVVVVPVPQQEAPTAQPDAVAPPPVVVNGAPVANSSMEGKWFSFTPYQHCNAANCQWYSFTFTGSEFSDPEGNPWKMYDARLVSGAGSVSMDFSSAGCSRGCALFTPSDPYATPHDFMIEYRVSDTDHSGKASNPLRLNYHVG